eukprot:TRINITY_DN2027_c1_g1_i1.p1 TRINITY_DN2027_c1_g1~~TRINITY_DN2027_c1_g1_i1.p1  ORF type:complete len:569 (+),score=93.84 TRINITY_DN2027_c1_g1_i1:124-1830(+)
MRTPRRYAGDFSAAASCCCLLLCVVEAKHSSKSTEGEQGSLLPHLWGKVVEELGPLAHSDLLLYGPAFLLVQGALLVGLLFLLHLWMRRQAAASSDEAASYRCLSRTETDNILPDLSDAGKDPTSPGDEGSPPTSMREMVTIPNEQDGKSEANEQEEEGLISTFTRQMRQTTDWADKLGQLEQTSPDREAQRKEDMKFLHDLRYRLIYSACGNFLVTPLWLVASLFQPAYMKYMVAAIALKGCVVALIQMYTFRSLKQWLESRDPATKDLFQEHFYKPLVLFGVNMPVPRWVKFAGIACIEYIEPDLDSANAGQSWHFRGSLSAHFESTWQNVPVFGGMVGTLGLSGVLTLLFAFAQLVQIVEFAKMMHLAAGAIDRWPPIEDKTSRANYERIGVWTFLQNACDSSSFSGMAEALHTLAQSEHHKKKETAIKENRDPGYCYAGRSSLFRVKVLAEGLPSLWFSISLLGLAIDHSLPTQLVIMIASVVIAMAIVVLTSKTEFGGVKESIRMGWIIFGYGDQFTMGAAFRLGMLLLAGELLLACMLRVGGVFYCDSHVLNLTHGCYAPQS